MQELLSQDEIDALLSTVDARESEGKAKPGTPEAPKNLAKYDFRKPTRSSSEQIRMLQGIYDGYARALSVSLSSFLMTPLEVKLVTVDELAYGEYASQTMAASCLYVLKLAKTQHRALLDINPPLAFAMIERLLGGKGLPFEGKRSFTEIEASLFRKVIQGILAELRKAWASVADVEFSIEEREIRSGAKRIAAPQDSIVRATLEVRMQSVTGTLNVCLPFDLLEAVLPQPAAQETAAPSAKDGKAQQTFRNNLLRAHIPLHVDLGKIRLTVRELLDLKAGDVVEFAPGSGSNTVLAVAGKPKFLGRPGLVGKKVAVLVVGAVAPEG